MILLFLGSWRSTLVVMISIPLAILTSLVGLFFLGETLNTMTLGGLALAVGILVDDSTVTIENTHRLLTEEQHAAARGDAARRGRHRRADAGLDARHLLRVHLGRCSSTARRKYLFTPLGLAVVFAMLASYGLSRTLTPITIGLLLKGEHQACIERRARRLFARFHAAFERGFERCAHGLCRAAWQFCSSAASSCRSAPCCVLALGAADVHLRRPRLLPG